MLQVPKLLNGRSGIYLIQNKGRPTKGKRVGFNFDWRLE